MKKLILGFILLGCLVLAADVQDQINAKKKELKSIYAKINEQKKVLNQTDQKARKVMNDIKAIDQILVQQNKTKIKIEKQTKDLSAEARNLQTDLKEENKKFQAVVGELEEKYYFYYKNSHSDFIEQFLNMEDVGDQINALYFFETLISSDVNFLKKIEDKNHQLKYMRERLAGQLEILKDKQQSVEQLNHKILTNRRTKKDLLDQLMTEKRAFELKEKKLWEDSQDIERHIQNLLKSAKSFDRLGDGKYIWPVLGKISSSYGWRFHPILKVRSFHTGLDIYAPKGRPIFAVDEGVVIFAGKWGRYGNVVMIDHGAKVTTLYAHMSKYLVKRSVYVKKGQVIGLVGETGYATGPHLHFEVRINGKVQNPIKYLPKR